MRHDFHVDRFVVDLLRHAAARYGAPVQSHHRGARWHTHWRRETFLNIHLYGAVAVVCGQSR